MKTHTEILYELTAWAAHYAEIKSAMKPLDRYLAVENPLGDAVVNLFDAYTRLVAGVVGDGFETLNWYCLDNDMGLKGMKASPPSPHKMRPIRNLDDLATLIFEGQE